MTTTYLNGDTIMVRVTFRDYSTPPTVGDPVDPDEISVKIYDAKKVLLRTVPDGDPTIIRNSTGVYSYEWTLPTTDGTYFIEFTGMFGTYPEIIRHQVKTKWKPVE